MKPLTLTLTLLLLTACSSLPCHIEARQYLQQNDAIIATWLTATDTGNRQQLQVARDEAVSLEAPGCAEEMKRLLVEYMDGYLDGNSEQENMAAWMAFVAVESRLRGCEPPYGY
jgi:hypothetical protein